MKFIPELNTFHVFPPCFTKGRGDGRVQGWGGGREPFYFLLVAVLIRKNFILREKIKLFYKLNVNVKLALKSRGRLFKASLA